MRPLILASLTSVVCVPSFVKSLAAQQSERAGTVANARNGTTIFSGDLLKTGETGRLQVQSGTMQLVFDANSAGRIFRSGDRVAVELERGPVSYSAKGVSENLTMFAQDIKFVPRTSELAVGQITIVSHCEVRAGALWSALQATSGKETRTIESNTTYQVLSDMGVDYNDGWKPSPQDYPEYPRDAEYHHSHTHVACSPGDWQSKNGPAPPGKEGPFRFVVAGAFVVVATIPLLKAIESPDKP